jgi:outer membrane receptor for ferrienterochelin and colicins
LIGAESKGFNAINGYKHKEKGNGVMKQMGACSWVVLLLFLWLTGVPAAYAAESQSDDQHSDGTPSKANETATALDEMVVTGTKTPHTLKDVPVETIVINAADIQKTNAQNVMGVLKAIPGLSVANHDDVFGTYTWRATLQGLPFDAGYGLVLIDGQRAMGCGQSGGMGEYGIGLNQIPVSMIDRIEVVKGPGSALYGSDAMTGVINVITKKIPDEPTGWAGVSYGWYDVKRQLNDGSEEEADGDRNLHQANVGYGDRIGDSAGYLLAYNFEGADDITADPLASQRHSIMGKIDARAGERVKLFSKLELSDYRKTDNRDEDSLRVSLGGEWQVTQSHLLSLKGYTYTWDFVHGSHGDPYGYKNGNVGFNQAELQDTWKMTQDNTLTLGGELQEQRIDYGIENQDGSLISVDESVKTSSLFLQDELVLWEKVTLVGGARFDDHSVFGSEINPKFSAMIRLAEATTLRGSIGRSFKSPTIRQLYYDAPYRHGTFYAQSNRDLKPEKAVGYTISLEQRLNADRIMLNLGYFHNDLEDLVVRVDTGTLYNGLPLVVYENVEKGWTQGLEFMCRAKFGDSLEVALAYTYTQTENEASGKELTYVPDHSISLRPSYELKPLKLGVSAGITYTGRQYTDAGNTAQIDAQTVVDAKIYKYLSSSCKLSFEADDIFDAKENSVNSYYAGRTFVAKLDLEF